MGTTTHTPHPLPRPLLPSSVPSFPRSCLTSLHKLKLRSPQKPNQPNKRRLDSLFDMLVAWCLMARSKRLADNNNPRGEERAAACATASRVPRGPLVRRLIPFLPCRVDVASKAILLVVICCLSEVPLGRASSHPARPSYLYAR